MKLFTLSLVLSLNFFLASCTKKKDLEITNTQNVNVLAVQNKIKSFQPINRIEIRNYIKNTKSKYQTDIRLIKKIKMHLDKKSNLYLEINFFTNEDDSKAPLVAQFMLFDEKSKNLVSEFNLNLD